MCAIDITAEQRKTVLALLARHLPNTTAWVYGSRVKWTSRPESDLDLVVFAKPEQERRVSDLREAFEESNLAFRVDLSVWDDVPEQFRKQIEAEQVVLVEKEERRVGGEWSNMPFSDAVLINPPVPLERAKTYPFVGMAAVDAGSRFAYSSDQRDFRGGGSRFENGDTLMARITPCLENGKVARYRTCSSPGSAHGSTEFIVIRGRPNVTDPAFAFYLTRWEEVRNYAIGQMTGTSGRQRVPTESLDHLMVSIPLLPEQRVIAHILGTLDDKIELNRQMNQTLEEMARALFKSWFVDFDPVRAKSTLRHHDTCVTPPQGGSDWSVERARAYLDRMDPNIAALFPDSFVDSELGPIPAGWEVKALGDFVVNFDSKRIPVSKARRVNRPGIFPYYGAAGLMDYIDDYIFDGIYLLIGEDGSVVKSNDLAVTQYVWGRLWVNNHAHVLQGRGSVSTEQLYLNFNFEPVGPYVTGAVQPKLSQGRMNTMPFVFAGDDVCRAFATAVDPWFAKLRSVTDANKILGALRDTLLPKLMSGEIRIKDITLLGAVPQLAR